MRTMPPRWLILACDWPLFAAQRCLRAPQGCYTRIILHSLFHSAHETDYASGRWWGDIALRTPPLEQWATGLNGKPGLQPRGMAAASRLLSQFSITPARISTPGQILRAATVLDRDGYHSRKITCHDEEGLLLEALVVRPQSFGVVVFFYIYDFFRGGHSVDRYVIVSAVLEDNKSTVDLVKNQVESKIAVGHRDDRVDRVGITTADQIAQLLVDDVYEFAVVVFR